MKERIDVQAGWTIVKRQEFLSLVKDTFEKIVGEKPSEDLSDLFPQRYSDATQVRVLVLAVMQVLRDSDFDLGIKGSDDDWRYWAGVFKNLYKSKGLISFGSAALASCYDEIDEFRTARAKAASDAREKEKREAREKVEKAEKKRAAEREEEKHAREERKREARGKVEIAKKKRDEEKEDAKSKRSKTNERGTLAANYAAVSAQSLKDPGSGVGFFTALRIGAIATTGLSFSTATSTKGGGGSETTNAPSPTLRDSSTTADCNSITPGTIIKELSGLNWRVESRDNECTTWRLIELNDEDMFVMDVNREKLSAMLKNADIE
jgi:hypothetical protein